MTSIENGSTEPGSTERGLGRFVILLPPGEVARRLPFVVVGLVIFGLGVAMMLVAELGLPPWDVFHQGVSELTGLSIGTITILVGLVVLLGFIPLREKLGIGTVLNAFLIGGTLNVVMPLIDEVDQVWLRVVLMLGGPVFIAIGSGLYIGGGLGPGPRDGVMTGLAKRGIPIARARTGIEVTVLIIGVLLGGTVGVGTLWFAFGIGPLIGFFLPRFTVR